MNRRAQFFPLRDENPRHRTPFVTWALIAANTLAFLASLVAFDAIIGTFGFTPARFSLLTLFSSMFLHGGIMHLVGNMWFLFIFGDNVEDMLGHWWYLLFYLAAGVAAALTHLALNVGSPVPVVGASGAISGVLGAYLVFFPHVKVHVAGRFGSGVVSAGFMLAVWFGYQLVLGTIGLFGAQSSIAFWAHAGGFAFGAATAWLMKNSISRSRAPS
jgi:membrane associated rhomboid family serine protease